MWSSLWQIQKLCLSMSQDGVSGELARDFPLLSAQCSMTGGRKVQGCQALRVVTHHSWSRIRWNHWAKMLYGREHREHREHILLGRSPFWWTHPSLVQEQSEICCRPLLVNPLRSKSSHYFHNLIERLVGSRLGSHSFGSYVGQTWLNPAMRCFT